MPAQDSRFALDSSFEPESGSHAEHSEDLADDGPEDDVEGTGSEGEDGDSEEHSDWDGLGSGMDPEGFVGPSKKTVKPLTPESLAAFKAAQDKAGVVYISRIPPGMRPTKVRHLMNIYGEIGRVYLQQEDAKRAYLRRKYTSTKKAHYTEGWVEFKDKRVARSVAEMLNAQPIGGKKGTRWRDDVWTMKYLPKFKWNMLTEQIAHEAAVHAAQLRVELSQSRKEQREYLKHVELARVLDKRAERKRKAEDTDDIAAAVKKPREPRSAPRESTKEKQPKKKHRIAQESGAQLDSVLDSIL